MLSDLKCQLNLKFDKEYKTLLNELIKYINSFFVHLNSIKNAMRTNRHARCTVV